MYARLKLQARFFHIHLRSILSQTRVFSERFSTRN